MDAVPFWSLAITRLIAFNRKTIRMSRPDKIPPVYELMLSWRKFVTIGPESNKLSCLPHSFTIQRERDYPKQREESEIQGDSITAGRERS